MAQTQHNYPLVSIIIPVHNRKDYARLAIDSALAQSYVNIEVIVVDDASDDGTFEALQELDLPIILLQNSTNKGPAGSRNAGIKASHGDYLFFLDSDDALEQRGVEILHQALQEKQRQDRTWGVAYGKLRTCDADLKPVPVKPKAYCTGNILIALLQDNPVRTGSYLIRKDIVTEVNGFFEELFDHEDFLFYCLVAVNYKFTFVDQYISKFRRHKGDRARHNYEKILKPNIVHLDYFFANNNNLPQEILQLKNRLYANEHLQMAKIAWRSSRPKEYVFHWRKALGYKPSLLLHPKYTFRLFVSKLRC